MLSVYLCICISPLSDSEFLNQLYETWNLYHATRALLNCVRHKFLPTVCVYIYIPLLLLGKGSVEVLILLPGKGCVKDVTVSTNIEATIKELLDSSFSVRSVA
jgi:hypothetical protein